MRTPPYPRLGSTLAWSSSAYSVMFSFFPQPSALAAAASKTRQRQSLGRTELGRTVGRTVGRTELDTVKAMLADGSDVALVVHQGAWVVVRPDAAAAVHVPLHRQVVRVAMRD